MEPGPLNKLSASQMTVILFLLGMAAYFNSIFHPFVHDDIVFIQQNPNLSRWDHLAEIFIHSDSSPWPAGGNPYYRPLLDVLYKVQYLFFGLNPYGFHFFNVLVHIANSILIFIVTRFFAANVSLAFLTASLFLIHPVQTESVACIAGISNLIYALAVLSSFLLYILARAKYGGRYSVLIYALSLIYFTMALFFKEQAIVLPALILLFDFSFPSKEVWTKEN